MRQMTARQAGFMPDEEIAGVEDSTAALSGNLGSQVGKGQYKRKFGQCSRQDPSADRKHVNTEPVRALIAECEVAVSLSNDIRQRTAARNEDIERGRLLR